MVETVKTKRTSVETTTTWELSENELEELLIQHFGLDPQNAEIYIDCSGYFRSVCITEKKIEVDEA